jgi:hypothetical protein
MVRFSLLLLSLAMAMPPATAAAQAPSRQVRNGRSWLHFVRGRFKAPAAAVSEVRRQEKTAGTAFLIKGGKAGDEAWVMTNHHVVWDPYNDKLSAYHGRPDFSLRFGSEKVHPTRFVYTNDRLDVAIMAFKIPQKLAGLKPLRLLDRDVRAGEALCAIGFPNLRRGSEGARGWWCDRLAKSPKFKNRPDNPWVPGLKILALGREINRGQLVTEKSLPKAPLIRHNLITFQGSSGSPLLAKDGVIGLESRGDPMVGRIDQPPPSHAVSMKAILGELRARAPDVASGLRRGLDPAGSSGRIRPDPAGSSRIR